jgi:hypothetical protein
MKIKTIQNLTHGSPERKISIKSEIHPKIPQTIISIHNIHKKHPTKNHINWNSFGMANQLIKLDITRCDTNCHTYLHMIIKQKPQMVKMQTQHQNVQPRV